MKPLTIPADVPIHALRAHAAVRYFRALGEGIAKRWRAQNYDERRFSAIACEALDAQPPAEHVRYRDVVEALLFGDALPLQPTDLAFGQPPIVVYSHARFYIEVLCWMDATTTIHQHAFSGAFHVLEGSSVHTTFAFEPVERIHGALLLGRLALLGAELLSAGDTRAILAGTQLIHGLFHLQSPSISVVVRTRSEPDSKPQYDYLPPCVAVDPLAIDPLDKQRGDLLAMLLSTDRPLFFDVMGRLFEQSDLPAVFQLLRFAYQRCMSAPFDLSEDALEPWLRCARRRFGARVDALLSAVTTAARVTDIQLRRAEIRDPDHRFFLALLMNLPNRQQLLRLVRERYATEPAALVLRWLRELTTVSGGQLQLLDASIDGDAEPAQLRTWLSAVLEAMVHGARGAALVERVAASLDLHGRDDVRAFVPALEAVLASGALHALFASDPGEASEG